MGRCRVPQRVHAAGHVLGEGPSVQRVDFGSSAPTEWYLSHIAGCMVPFCARKGVAALEDGLSVLMNNLRDYWQSRNWPAAMAKAEVKQGFTAGGEGDDVPF